MSGSHTGQQLSAPTMQKKLLWLDCINSCSNGTVHLGTSKQSIQSMILTLHHMNHHLWSSFVDSKITQNRTHWGEPIAGIGQGNWASPQIWAAVSAPLFQVLLQDGFIATFICSLSHHHRPLAGFGFIDNMDLCINDTTNNVNIVAEKLQKSLDMWARLLQMTGGALMLEKCFWYLLHPVWCKGKWAYTQGNDDHGLNMLNDKNTKVIIPRLPPCFRSMPDPGSTSGSRWQ